MSNSVAEEVGALIVVDYFGSTLEGGIPAALRTLIYLFRMMGVAVHCMVLQISPEIEEEANKYGVKLILPTIPDTPRYKGVSPDQSWLYCHKVFYPTLKDLKNIRYVCGFGLVSSDCARFIRDELITEAKFVLINTMTLEKEFETHRNLLGYENLRDREKGLNEELHKADLVCSTWREVYTHFEHTCDIKSIPHTALHILPHEGDFERYSLSKLEIGEEMIIMTPIHADHFSADEKCGSGYQTLTGAIKSYFNDRQKANFRTRPAKWKIIHVTQSDKKCNTVQYFKAGDYVTVSEHAFDPTYLNGTDLCQCHLVLIPPESMVSLKFALTAIALGIPIIAPLYSQSYDFIVKHLSLWGYRDIVVDMNRNEKLCDILNEAYIDYAVFHNRAGEIRLHLQEKMKKLNDEFTDIAYRLIKE